MPRVLADYGQTMLVQFPDGTQQEVIRDSFERAFPGGQYQDRQPDLPPEPPPAAPPAPAPEPAFTPPNPVGAFGRGPVASEAAPLSQPSLGGPPPALTPPTVEPPQPGPAPLHDPSRGAEIQTLDEYAQGTRDYGASRIGTVQDLGDLESQELTRTAAALDEHDRRARTLEDERIKAHEGGLAAAERKATEIDDLSKKYTEAKIDRGRLFKNMSTGNKVLAAIGFGLSAIGQAKSRTPGPNPAIQIMLGAIEADVQDQAADIQKTGQAVEQKRGLYKEFLAQLGNKQAAYDMSMAVSAAQAKRQIEIIGAQSGSAKVKLQADDMAAQLGQFVADKQELIRSTASADAYRVWQMRLAEIKQAGRGKAKDKRAASIDDVAERLGITNFRDRERLVVVDPSRNEGFLAQTKEQASEVNKKLASVDSFNEVASRLLRNIKRNGWQPTNERWKSEKGGEMIADYNTLVMLSKDTESLGAISGADMELVRKMLGGDPGLWRAGAGDQAQLERTMRNLNGRLSSSLRRYGYRGEYKPTIATEDKAETTDVADRNLKLKAAVESKDPAKIQEAAKELIGQAGELGGLEGAYATADAKKQARAAIDLLGRVPKKDRSINLNENGAVRSVDPLDYLSQYATEGGSKDRAKQERAAPGQAEARSMAAKLVKEGRTPEEVERGSFGGVPNPEVAAAMRDILGKGRR